MTQTKKLTWLTCGYSFDVEIPEGYTATMDEETGNPIIINESTGEFITVKCPVCKATMDRLRWK